MSMNFPMAPTLSIITEATERSGSPHPSYEPVRIPDSLQYLDTYYDVGGAHVPRASIFSSETSYGEPLPPGQSKFMSLGLGVSSSHYEKSLPSLPRGSVVAMSVSARSGQKTESMVESVARSEASRMSVVKSAESLRPSIARSESPRHSVVKSEHSRHSVAKSEHSRHSIDKQESHQNIEDKSRTTMHPSPKPTSTGRSSVRSESSMPSERVKPVPISAGSPPLPALPTKISSTESISTVSTHSSSHSIARSGPRSRSMSSATSSSPPTSVSSASTSTLRTYDDVVDEVAASLVVRAAMHAETIPTADCTKIGVCETMSRGDDQSFMRILASKLHHSMALHSSYLFALIPSGPSAPGHTTLVFCGDPQELVTKASILAGLRFKTRLAELQDTDGTWMGQLETTEPTDSWDVHVRHEDVLWDIIRKAANPTNPVEPPPGSRGIERILVDARARLDRLNPSEAHEEAMRDGILVDIRPAMQRAEHGTIPGALIIERNVLEWRFDPRCVGGRLPIADRYDLRVIVYCQEGYTSSLAAAALQDIGLWQATDIDGGFARWKNEGFPVNRHVDVLAENFRSATQVPPRHGPTTRE